MTAAYITSTGTGQSVTASASTAESLSGFIISVYVNGTSPIPANSNPNWPHVVFEAGFGSGFNTPDSEVTWTDISARLWDWDETTGIQYQLGQLRSTDLTMHLDNIDGYLIPSNTTSPYYPNVQPGTPLRLRAALGTMGGTAINRWYIIQRNAAQWGEDIDEVYRRYCPVTATDLWAALSSVSPSFYRSEVYEDSPYAWWTCSDLPGTAGVLPVTLLNSALGNTNPLNILLSPLGGGAQTYVTEAGGSTLYFTPPGAAVYTVGADQGWMPGDPPGAVASIATEGGAVTQSSGSAAWQASSQAGSSGSYGWYLSCNDASFPSPSSGVTVEVWFNAGFYGSATGVLTGLSSEDNYPFSPVTAQPYNSPITILELATATAPVVILQLSTAGYLTMNGTTIYSASDLRSSSWHMITMTMTSTTYQVWLDGGANANVTGSGSFAAFTWLIANGDMGSNGGGSPSSLVHGGNVALSHIAVYPTVLPYYRVLDHYWAAVTAFGQLPAPTGVQVSWTGLPLIGSLSAQQDATTVYNPDGTPAWSGQGETTAFVGSVNASAVVVATVPGTSITSGSSAWVSAGAAGGENIESGGSSEHLQTFILWISWTGLAPSFSVYTSASVGNNTQAAIVNGSGDSFTAYATGVGVCQTAAGNGSSPPALASSTGDTVGQRIERLMRGGRCTSPNRCIDQAPLLVVAQGQSGSGQQAGSAIQAIQQSDSGMLFVDNCNHLTYWQRTHLASQYPSPLWQIGPTTSAGRIPYYQEVHWVTDPQRVYNVISVTPISPTGATLPILTPVNASGVLASQIRYGAQPLSISSWLQSTTEMQNQANWLFQFFGTPQRHMENVKIDAAAYPLAWQLVLGINVGDIVLGEDWVIGGGGTVYTYRVTEIKRHISQGFGEDPATTASVTLTLDYEPTSYWS